MKKIEGIDLNDVLEEIQQEDIARKREKIKKIIKRELEWKKHWEQILEKNEKEIIDCKEKIKEIDDFLSSVKEDDWSIIGYDEEKYEEEYEEEEDD